MMRTKVRSKLSKAIHDPSGLFHVRVVENKKKYSRKRKKNIEKCFCFSYDSIDSLRSRMLT